jgi:hypothetical protein
MPVPEKSLPESLAQVPIEKLSLSTRSFNALRAGGLKTLGQVFHASDEQLLRFYAFGRKSLNETRRAIAEYLDSMQSRFEPIELPHSADGRTSELSSGGWFLPGGRFAELNAPIDALDLSTRPADVLSRLQINSVQELLNYPKQKLLRAKNVGRKSLAEIERKLSGYLTQGDPLASIMNLPSHESELPGTTSGTMLFVNEILARLPERQRDVIADRFGLWDGIAETLQDIGDKLGVTRERIRQIEAKGLARLHRMSRDQAVRGFIIGKVSRYLASAPERTCGLLTEDEALGTLADDCSLEQAAIGASFLQDLDAPGESLFGRHLVEAEPGVYCMNGKVAAEYKFLRELIELALQRHQKPVSEQTLRDDLAASSAEKPTDRQAALLRRLLTISPSVVRLRNGTIAFSTWTEFRRHDATSLAQATLRLLGRQAHFREITERIGALFPDAGPVNERSVHNALVQNQRKFVWVAPGTYGLVAWGLKRPPFIKDRLMELLSESRYPLPLWYLNQKVLEVCNCKEASVRMTLDLNPSLFRKFEGDQYGLREYFNE